MATELNVKLNNTLNGTSLKAIQDKNGNDITQTYLNNKNPVLNGNSLRRNIDNNYLQMDGATRSSLGANIVLYSGEYENYKGEFRVSACKTINDGTIVQTLLAGTPEGELKWNQNDLAGSAIIAKQLSDNGYIKYNNGLIVQWGIVTNVNNPLYTETVSFNINFVRAYNINGFLYEWNDNETYTVQGYNLSSFIYSRPNRSKTIRWCAIGY